MLEHIQLFFSKGKGRATNDLNNRIREDILLLLLNPPEQYIIDTQFGEMWQTMSFKWREFLNNICDKEFDNISVKKIANRKNFDLEINYLRNGENVHKILGEFKHNCKTIGKLPQYYSASENKRYIPQSYGSYFYDQYLDQICNLANIEKINKETYMKHLYQHDHNVNDFFKKLREVETTIEKEKKKIVHESIKNYLNQYSNDLSIELLKKDIQSQKEKTFILWDCKNFYKDSISLEELDLERIEKIKKDNTIVVSSKAGTTHNMLLRWRNHLGILYPAWQISLERLEEQSQVQS